MQIEILLQGVYLHPEDDSLYKDCCEFVASQFQARFGCQLAGFYPTFLASWDKGEIQAVLGIRNAADDSLFLEQYLDAPVEQVIAAHTGKDIAREHIVEIGAFAALNQNAAFPLMIDAAERLTSLGYKMVICTANKPIRTCLRKLGINHIEIAVAQKDAVPDNWGTYYDSDPLVLCGDIGDGNAAIKRLTCGAV